MAQIGHGYGSEWQLLRMLGHHRNYFENLLKEQIGLKGDEDIDIEWLDYKFSKSKSSISGDGEYLNLDFLDKIPFAQDKKDAIRNDWKEFNVTGQNWDGIFYAKDKLYLVEAKAHIGEIESKYKNQNESDGTKEAVRKAADEIRGCMFKIQEEYVNNKTDWEATKYYQLANRLSAAIFLEKHGIKTSVVNIYFINGYSGKMKDGRKYISDPTKQKSVVDKEYWNNAIKEECEELNLNEKGKALIHSVFVDCMPTNELASDTKNQD